MCAWSSIVTGKSMTSTLVEEASGETLSRIEKEQRLYSELKALSKRYPVIVNFSGSRFGMGRLQSMSLGNFTVRGSVVTVPREHVMVMLSQRPLNGHKGENKYEMVYDRSVTWGIDSVRLHGSGVGEG